mmetsp:Transcript_17222/g.29006  ORF Transcript_17222/g.29006 Transcript_17222/m.29006 type:complete len:158 (-) Transcript_17222:791-1264(-)|eukprot:CAMPEP_0168613578 /NCGR_PEP_ID=MMETSP0449_2-20121227/3524_1 /TAXON_ID=1082188 /ORGANISM="Strombidium rassoulzadegani, Strain ras09" /LENGTH=157 /DNA_ID=CAMNT_0008654217 /DNA_START=281 /DNA_END=754 /DNA_ORIENTATION=-
MKQLNKNVLKDSPGTRMQMPMKYYFERGSGVLPSAGRPQADYIPRDRTMSSNTYSINALSNEVEVHNSSEAGSHLRSESCKSGSSSLMSAMSIEDKRLKVLKYWEKKKLRMNKNHVRYHCRKDLAQNRFRYHGRFISKNQMERIISEEGGFNEIYDP